MSTKPERLTLDLGKQHDIITTSLVNRLFSKLQEILVYHKIGGQSGSGFEGNPNDFNTNIAAQHAIITDNPPKKIKEYVTVLESSKYIPDDVYSAQVPIPIKSQTIITSLNNYLEEVRIINELLAFDADDASYDGSYCGVYSPSEGCSSNYGSDFYGDGWNATNRTCAMDSNYASYNGGHGFDGCCGYGGGDSDQGGSSDSDYHDGCSAVSGYNDNSYNPPCVDCADY